MIWTAQKGMHDGVYLTVQWCHHHSELRVPQLCLLRAAVRYRTCSNQSIKKAKSCSCTCKISKHVCCILKSTHFYIVYSALEFSNTNTLLEMDELSLWVTAFFFVLPYAHVPICTNLQQMHRGAKDSHFYSQMIEHAQMHETI